MAASNSSGVQVAVGGSSSRVVIDVGSSTSSNSSSVSSSNVGVIGVQPASQALAVINTAPSSPQDGSERNSDVAYDPNEPRYCVCNEVAFGDMVACDNKTVSFDVILFLYFLVLKCFSIIFTI